MAYKILLLFLLPMVSASMVTLSVEDFGTFKGEAVKKYTWRTKSNFSVSVISYGAIIQSVVVPDRYGQLKDVVLGFDDLDGYVNRNSPYLGATVGRCANRIAGGWFEIDGVRYNVAKNVGENHLHGGLIGFDKVNWNSTVDGAKVIFSYLSNDGEEGYPGALLTTLSVEVKDDNSIELVFQSTTTKKTVVNLTNHSYFNLAGHEAGSVEMYNHVIAMNANKITETDSESIPTGMLLDVGGTPFDLRRPTRIGDVINKQDNLFDDNFCVANFREKELNFVARVVHPSSGRSLELFSDQPGVQFYTGNFIASPQEQALVGKNSEGYRSHGAFCLETQKYPDAVHHTNFPSTILTPGEVYTHHVVYKFGLEEAGPSVVSM